MKKVLAIGVLLIFTAFLMTMATGFHFGAPLKSDMDDYFLKYGQIQTATNNQCTSVTFDFRGFDTLGESTVLFTAVIGVALMFRQFSGGEEDADE
jgi:multisubunit Na+/H+ antiporter MnhB subunit